MRTIKVEEGAQLEHDQVLTAMNLYSLRNFEDSVKKLIFDSNQDAAIVSGLEISHNTGWDLSISGDAAVLQNASGRLKIGIQDQFNDLTVPASDPTNDRIDIVQARVNIISTKTDPSIRKIVDPTLKKFEYVSGDREYEIVIETQVKSGIPSATPIAPSITDGTSAILQGIIAHPPTLDMTNEYILEIAHTRDGEFVAIDLRGATPSATTLAEIVNKVNLVFPGIMSVDGSNQFVITGDGIGEESFFQIREYRLQDFDAREKLFGVPQINGYRDEYIGNNQWFKIGEILIPAGSSELSSINIYPVSKKDSWSIGNNIDILPAYNSHRDSADLDHPNKSVRLRHLSDEVIRSLEAKDVRSAELRNQLDKVSIQILDLKIVQSYLMLSRSIRTNHIIDTFFNYSREGHFDTTNISPAEIITNIWDYRHGNPGDPTYKPGKLVAQKKFFHGEPIDKIDISNSGYPYKCAEKYDPVNKCYWRITNNGENQPAILLKIAHHRHRGAESIIGSWTLQAGGAGTYWSGIVVDYLDSQNVNLNVILHGDGASSGMAKIKVNTDGTLSLQNIKSGGEIPHNTIVDGTSTYAYTAYKQGIVPYFFNDGALVNDTDILIIACDDSVDPSPTVLIPVGKDDNGSGQYQNPTTITVNQTGLERFIRGNDVRHRSIDAIIETQKIYVKIHDTLSSEFSTFELSLVDDFLSNALISASEKYRTIREIAYDATGNGGIFIDETGEVVEVISTPTQGRFLLKSARKFADHPEGVGIIKLLKVRNSSWVNLTSPSGIEYKRSNGSLYTFDTVGGVVRLYRQKVDGTVNSSIVTIVTVGYDIAIDEQNNKIWFSVLDVGAKYEVHYGLLSTIDARLDIGANIVSGIDINVITQTNNNTDILRWITYDPVDNLLYVINGTDNKIDSIGTGGVGAVWVQGVFHLGAPVTDWGGISYEDGRLYVTNRNSGASGSFVEILKKSKLTSAIKYVVGYIRPDTDIFTGTNIGGGLAFDENGNIIIISSGTSEYRFFQSQSNSNVQPLNTFFTSENILLSNNVSDVTKIHPRYFSPEEYIARENIIHDYIMVASYSDEGFTVFGLDEYFSERTKSTGGNDKYDPAEVAVWHTNIGVSNAIGSNPINAIEFEKDMIFASDNTAGAKLYFFDLKTSDIRQFGTTNTVNQGSYYNGGFPERNDALGYNSLNQSTMGLSPQDATGMYINRIVAKTFSSNDQSDYDRETKTTYVAIAGMNATYGFVDVMIIDWGENGERAIKRVIRDIFGPNTLYGARGAVCISDSGKIFAAKDQADSINKVAFTDIFSIDSGYSISYSGNFAASTITDIRPYSYKMTTGAWREFLYFATVDRSTTSGHDYSCGIFDVDQDSVEYIVNSSTGVVATEDGFVSIDFDDKNVYALFEENIYAGTRQNGRPLLLKREYFDDNKIITATQGSPYLGQGWTTDQNIINASGAGYFYTRVTGNSTSKRIHYSKIGNSVIIANNYGIQMMHSFFAENSSHESIEYELSENPVRAHFLSTIYEPVDVPKRITRISKEDNSLQWINGNTQTWQGIGGAVAVEVESAGYIEDGLYSFTNSHLIGLKKNTGSPLVLGTDYTYDHLLDDNTIPPDVDIYDNLISGSLTSGTYMRAIENGKNITDATGLKLSPVSKRISSIHYPPSTTEIFIDPARAEIEYPRPFFWDIYGHKDNRLGTGIDPIYTTAKGRINGILTIWQSLDSPPGYTGSTISYYKNPLGTSASSGYFYNDFYFDANGLPLNDEFTISVWNKFDSISDVGDTLNTYLRFQFYDINDILQMDVTLHQNYNGPYTEIVVIDGVSQTTTLRDQWRHSYILFDKNNGLNGGKSVIYKNNNAEIHSSTKSTMSSIARIRVVREHSSGDNSRFMRLRTSNIKIYSHIPKDNLGSVIEDANYEYNSGSGNEFGLSPIYSPSNSYKIFNSQVGYFYKSESGSVFIARDGVIEGKLIWEPTLTPSMGGIHFVRSNNAGGCNITLYDITSATVVQSWNNVNINWYSLAREDIDLWFTFPDSTHLYRITVEHSGVDNPGVNDILEIEDLYIKDELIHGTVDSELVTVLDGIRRNAYPLIGGGTIIPSDSATFIADDTTSLFTLSGDHKVYDIIDMTIVYGSTTIVYDKFDPEITYGSNDPDYNNGIANELYEIKVKLISGSPIPVGQVGSVSIRYISAFNSILVKNNTTVSYIGGFLDKKQAGSLGDYGLELEYK